MPDAYATYEQMAGRVGESRLGRLLSAKTSTSSPKELADEALVEAAGEIDGYLSKGGFTLPIDFSEIADATQRLRLESWLRGVNITLALMSIVTEPSEEMCRSASHARKLLASLAAETYGLGGVKGSRPAFGAADTTLEPEIPRDMVENHFLGFGA